VPVEIFGKEPLFIIKPVGVIVAQPVVNFFKGQIALPLTVQRLCIGGQAIGGSSFVRGPKAGPDDRLAAMIKRLFHVGHDSKIRDARLDRHAFTQRQIADDLRFATDAQDLVPL